MDIVLIDEASFGADMALLPRGPLRETLFSLSRADVIVLTRTSGPSTSALDILAGLAPGKPVFSSVHAPYLCGVIRAGEMSAGIAPELEKSRDFEWLKQAKVFVFSGIAKNKAFQDMVAEMANVTGAKAFPDHHQYTDDDLIAIEDQAKNRAADFLVTTEKDSVKLHGRLKIPMDTVIMGIEVSFKDQESAFADCIKGLLAR
jgi:tetraacyldisaccharide 4'-kinase